ncbi:importin subunit alpha-8-like [Apium graveolens]|uniref:importin subunit alpha-8-like n=1 Tax=Apium graveolens TaxID=4045 RepID=UPI003D7BF8AE
MHSDSDNTINNSEGFEKSLRTRRNRPDSLATKPRHIYSDPPWVAKQLAFTIQRQEDKVIDLTRKIEDRVRKRLFEEAEDFTKELSIMINADPRLGDLLRNNFLNLLIQLLKHDTNPKLQIHAATILQPLVVCPSNGDVVVAIKHIIPIVVNLVRSREYQVRLQALWLLRNLIPTIPKSILEEALVTVTSFLVNDSTGYVVLDAAAETLSSSCQEYPNLSPELLKLALSALMKLIKSDILTILTSASWGLVLLCDGREEMVIEDEYLDNLVERLLDLINADRRIMIVSGLNVLGSLVRWGSDDAIEAIIKKEDTLASLMCLLKEEDMIYVQQACWIISNITARKEEHIKGVIDCKLIDPLFNVVQNHKLVDVKKEALWAISNAMCGVGPDQIECLRNICSKVLWDELLKPFLDDSQLFLVTLEGLAHMKLVEITCDGRQIDAAELQYIFKKIVYHFEWVTRCKILHHDDNFQISEGRLKFSTILFRFQGRQPHISLSCDTLENFVVTK